MSSMNLNWAAIEADPKFQNLHRRKSRFLWGLMAFSVFYYFLLLPGTVQKPDLGSGEYRPRICAVRIHRCLEYRGDLFEKSQSGI